MWADRTWSSFVGTATSRNLGGVGAVGPLRHEAASLPYGLATRASRVPGNRRFSSSVVVPIIQGTATSDEGERFSAAQLPGNVARSGVSDHGRDAAGPGSTRRDEARPGERCRVR